MKRIEQYMLENVDQTPKLQDTEECVRIAKEKDCIVSLRWHMRYSGKYKRLIRAEYDPQEYFEKHLPHIYGM